MRPRYSFSSRRTRTIDPHNQHKKPFPALAREVIRISDVILYVLDARFIEETRNRGLEKFMKDKNKLIITVLNKADLVEPEKIKEVEGIEELKPYILVSCKDFKGIGRLKEKVKIEVKRLRNSDSIVSDKQAEGVPYEDALMGHKRVIGKTQWLKLTRKAHVGVVGYPNTGKSSLINALTNRKVSRVSLQPGFTKGIQKVRFAKDILILDTPGVIEDDKSKEEKKKEETEKHYKVGARSYSIVKNPEVIVSNILKDNRELIESFYEIDTDGDVEVLLENLGKKRGFLSKGGIVDNDRTARAILKDWQTGKIKKKTQK